MIIAGSVLISPNVYRWAWGMGLSCRVTDRNVGASRMSQFVFPSGKERGEILGQIGRPKALEAFVGMRDAQFFLR